MADFTSSGKENPGSDRSGNVRLNPARAVAEKLISNQIIPGLAVRVQKSSQPADALALGTDAGGQPLTEETLFPVASITKLATALAVLRLVDAGRLKLGDTLAHYLPEAEAAKTQTKSVTVRMLLCHTAGLPEDLPDGTAPYQAGLNWDEIAQAALQTALVLPPMRRVLYSNLGYALLALLVERRTGRSFAQALKDIVLAPLQIEGYLGEEPPRSPAKIGGNLGDLTATDLEPYNSAFWRSLALPYGGLVTTAEGALRLVQAFRGRPEGFLSPGVVAEAASDQTRGLPGSMAGLFEWEHCPWGLGVELRGRKEPHVLPPDASPHSFGHAGASGTIVWMDPGRNISWFIAGPRLFFEWWQHMPEISAAIFAGYFGA